MDLVIIVVLIIFSFIPHFIYSNVVSKNNKNFYATIKINGKVYTEITIIKLASPSLAPGAINGTGSIRSIKDSTKAIETSRPI